ncbi:hypothetical protein M9Y10_001921 [Tritrichomonas musculus]|uniref:EF-hand domain-containing protein n=1 Tax=Tritrichomonas musculus TaxID=1915356 RepID=A0ABR2L8D1_9EUKA
MSRVQSCSLSESDISKLYHALDDDKNGLLDEEELKVLMRKLGMPESYAKLCMLFVGKGKSEINYEQFQKFLAILLLYKTDKSKFLDLVFTCMDQDDSNTLEIDEVFVFLRLLGIQCSLKQAAEILKIADIDKNKCLDRREFGVLVEALEESID